MELELSENYFKIKYWHIIERLSFISSPWHTRNLKWIFLSVISLGLLLAFFPIENKDYCSMSSVCANCWETASRKSSKYFLAWVWKCIYFTFTGIVEELKKTMFKVCLFIPSLYVPLLTLVTISFKFCLFILHVFSVSGVAVQVNRDTRVLIQGSYSMW